MTTSTEMNKKHLNSSVLIKNRYFSSLLAIRSLHFCHIYKLSEIMFDIGRVETTERHFITVCIYDGVCVCVCEKVRVLVVEVTT